MQEIINSFENLFAEQDEISLAKNNEWVKVGK
jgi:hypothetical protein